MIQRFDELRARTQQRSGRTLLLRGIAWSAKEPVDRFNELVWPGASVAK